MDDPLALFVLEIFLIFGLVGKRHDKKAKVIFKIYDATNWITNNYNTHIAVYVKKEGQSDNDIWSVNRI